jgi:hypothetical protein
MVNEDDSVSAVAAPIFSDAVKIYLYSLALLVGMIAPRCSGEAL